MITKRIIPCLDVRDGRVVKGVNFEGLRDVSSPVELAAYYSRAGADELVFYDITASAEGRRLFTDILTETCRGVFIPLTVGGGIGTLDDFERVLSCGADKVSVNSGAIRNPALIGEAAKRYGDQCVVLSVDVKRVGGELHVFARGGRDDTGLEAIEWIRRCVGDGAGEVVVNSIDTDGVRGGFDIPMLRAVPSMMRMAASSSRALMSSFLICTISRICARVILPAFSVPGFFAPEATPAAFFTRTAAGGDLQMNVNDRS